MPRLPTLYMLLLPYVAGLLREPRFVPFKIFANGVSVHGGPSHLTAVPTETHALSCAAIQTTTPCHLDVMTETTQGHLIVRCLLQADLRGNNMQL